ncbi:hypothetical protein J7M02_00415 [Candidatus Aerophobetes bacterium]|nr:hypothetical protein [Candidatus Aerophobetes bacterium]
MVETALSLINKMGPIIYTTFGWVLGFLGTLLLGWINQKKRTKNFKESLSLEFKEVIPQLARTHYLLKEALGGLDRDLLNWAQSMFSKFPKGGEKTLKAIERLLKRTDEELKVLASQTKVSKKETLSIKKIILPFLQQNFSFVSLLTPDLQRSVAAIQRNINSLNEEIDLYYFYFKKTFDSTLTDKNYELVNKNIDHAYQSIADLSYKTAERISKTLPDLSK